MHGVLAGTLVFPLDSALGFNTGASDLAEMNLLALVV